MEESKMNLTGLLLVNLRPRMTSILESQIIQIDLKIKTSLVFWLLHVYHTDVIGSQLFVVIDFATVILIQKLFNTECNHLFP